MNLMTLFPIGLFIENPLFVFPLPNALFIEIFVLLALLFLRVFFSSGLFIEKFGVFGLFL